jgi:hypothetical protein
MNPDFAQVTRVLLTSGWVDVNAGSYQEGERTGRIYPPIWWATTTDGKTISAKRRPPPTSPA